MNKLLIVVGLISLCAGSPALARGRGAFGSSDDVTVLPAANCAYVVPGAMRITGGPGTRSLGSLPIAARNNRGTAVVPVLSRVTPPRVPGRPRPVEEPAWNIDLTANLGRDGLPGNLMLVVFEASDYRAYARHRAVMFQQVQISQTECVALRFAFSPNDGARPGHIYRLQLVQAIRGHRVVLEDSLLALK